MNLGVAAVQVTTSEAAVGQGLGGDDESVGHPLIVGHRQRHVAHQFPAAHRTLGVRKRRETPSTSVHSRGGYARVARTPTVMYGSASPDTLASAGWVASNSRTWSRVLE